VNESRVQWYWRRLRSMSAAEIAYRVRQKVELEHDRVVTRRGAHLESELPQLAPPLLPIASADPERFRASYPEHASRTLDRADRILSGDILLFGHLPAHLDAEPDWHSDVLTGKQWPPAAFYGEISIRWGGAKTIWEPARQQHLTTLAQAYWLTHEPRYLDRLQLQLEAWFAQNTPYRGVHWTSGLEVAIRLITWLWILEFVSPEPFTPAVRRAWTEHVTASGDYLSRHLSRFSSANNHLIGEAAGLLAAAKLVPAWNSAPHWRKSAWNILNRELLLQVLPDGAPAEQASHYLGFIIDFYLLADLLGDENRSGLQPAGFERLTLAGEFLAATASFRFGDEDGGCAYDLGADEPELTESRVTSLAIICDAPRLRRDASSLDSRSWLLLGDQARERRVSTGLPHEPLPLDFPASGYSILESEHSRLLFDCAPLGYLSIAAHGHADCLAVWMNRRGRPLLVESGTYRYHEEPAWRTYFRGTAAHNTVRVDRRDQSEQTGRTMWGTRAVPRLLRVIRQHDFDFVEAEHDGYSGLDSPVIHRRAVIRAGSDYFVVLDRIEGAGQHLIERFFHFASGTAVTIDGPLVIVETGEENVRFSFGSTSPSTLRVAIGETNPIVGWNSPRFFEREAAPTLIESCRVSLPAVFATVIADDGVVERLQIAGDALTITGAGWSDELECGSAKILRTILKN
jgi:heparinase II/III-like protein